MPAAAIPAIIGAAGSIGGSLLSKNPGGASDAQAQAAAATGANFQTGQQLTGQAMPHLQAGLGYYRDLLSGRSRQQAATAPAASNINQAFQGAQANVERGFLRGGEKDKAVADLNRDKVNNISRLYAGVQPAAASALMTGGQNLLNTGAQMRTAVPGQYAQQGQLGLGVNKAQQESGAGFGNLLFGIMRGVGAKGKDGGIPAGSGPQITPGLSWINSGMQQNQAPWSPSWNKPTGQNNVAWGDD